MTDGVLHISPGDVVSGLEPDDLVEVQRIAPFGNKRLVEGVGMESRRVIKRPLSDEEISRLVVVRGKAHSFNGDPGMFLLATEAERIRIAYQFDPLFAVNSSIVDPLPHQVEAVYRYLLPLPRIRFLLADDTGAGKTIMAGLLIKELFFRGVLKKVLIVTPGGLTKQWLEEELQEKFGFYARLVNRASFDAEPGQFIRYKEGIFVVSIDFLSRNENCLRAAQDSPWDLIVVDEAHKLSAYEYGSKLDESGRYRAIKALCDKTDHLLCLTATLHRGRKDTFRRLLLLLDQDLFQKDEHVASCVQEQAAPYGCPEEDFEGERPITQARNRFFLRRLKEEMVDWNSQPLFKDRHTKTVGYDLTPEEKTLYEDVTKYVWTKRKEAIAKGAVLVDPNIARPQRIWLVRSTIKDGRIETRRRLAHEQLSVIAEDHMGLRTTSPSYLLNCVPPENNPELPDLPERSVEEIQSFAYEKITEGQFEEVKAARVEECNLRRDYLNNAFADLIMELHAYSGRFRPLIPG